MYMYIYTHTCIYQQYVKVLCSLSHSYASMCIRMYPHASSTPLCARMCMHMLPLRIRIAIRVSCIAKRHEILKVCTSHYCNCILQRKVGSDASLHHMIYSAHTVRAWGQGEGSHCSCLGGHHPQTGLGGRGHESGGKVNIYLCIYIAHEYTHTSLCVERDTGVV